MSGQLDYFHFWGKAQEGWHPLPYHSLDVAACAVTLVEQHKPWREILSLMSGLDETELGKWLGFFAALHDLGKFSLPFQWLSNETAIELGLPETVQEYKVRHDVLGWLLWKQELASAIDADERHAVWMRASTGHHGKPPSLTKFGLNLPTRRYFPREVIDVTRSYMNDVWKIISPNLAVGDVKSFEHASWWIAGLINLADWIGSSVEWFPYQQSDMSLDDYWEAARQRAAVAVSESGVVPEESCMASFHDLFPEYSPTLTQQHVDQLDKDAPFLLVIEDTTGSGKTEAALTAAGGQRFYFGLPTMATANGLWSRVADSASLQGAKTLSHSSRWLMPDSMSYASAWLNHSSRHAMLSAIGVGTIDQALLAVLYTKFNALRLIGLLGRTLIIDEVHAYDSYQQRLLEQLVTFHALAGGSIVLLSATMPMTLRQVLCDAWAAGVGMPAHSCRVDAYPLVTSLTTQRLLETPMPAASVKNVAVEWESTEKAVNSRIEKAASSGQCVCWIRNTVNDAIASYQQLKEMGLDVQLFHARFTLGDRLDIEQQVLEQFGKQSVAAARLGKVLVATQVVEQSLDLDFDLMVSDLCPVDLLIQRAGRLHRHNRGDRGKSVMIMHAPEWQVAPAAEWVSGWNRGTAYVYPNHGQLWLSMSAIRDCDNELCLPRDARKLVESVYGDSVDECLPEGVRAATDRAIQQATQQALTGNRNAIHKNSSYTADGVPRWDDEYAPTRLGEPSVEWLLVDPDGKPLNGTLAKSSVSLGISRLQSAPGNTDVKTASWQRVMQLDSAGACWEAVGQDGNRRPIRIVYNSKQGLLLTKL